MTKYLNEFVRCLEEQRYFDAHEALEVVWFPRRFESSKEVKLLRCFINASVSFELAKRGKVKQSKKVWLNYLKYQEFLDEINSPHAEQYLKIARYLENINLTQ